MTRPTADELRARLGLRPEKPPSPVWLRNADRSRLVALGRERGWKLGETLHRAVVAGLATLTLADVDRPLVERLLAELSAAQAVVDRVRRECAP